MRIRWIVPLLLGLVGCATKPPPADAPASATTTGLVILGEVVKVSHVPDPASVPYTECLTFLKYKVLSVEAGTYEQAELLAAHWGMKDGRLTPAAACRVGEKHRLTVEPLSQHPELERVMQADDTGEYTLPVYFVLDVR